MNARKAAYLSLMRCEKAGKYANLEADAAIRKYELDEAEKALFTQLVYGVIERQITLDYIISLYTKTRTGKCPNPCGRFCAWGCISSYISRKFQNMQP